MEATLGKDSARTQIHPNELGLGGIFMSTKVKEHIGSANEVTFKMKVETAAVIYVAIDVAKYYHKAIIFDMNKRILEQPFDFDLSRDGFDKLVEKIEFQVRQQQAKQIAIGLEATGHYHENLVEHLRGRGYSVYLFNPYATFKTRSLHLDYVKTDELDVKAIGEAMIMGKGREILAEPEVYRQLKLLTRFRRAKIQARQVLKNQMLRDLDKLWPGLLKAGKGDKLGLFFNLWNSKIARQILQLNILPQDLAQASPEQLVELCREKGLKNIGLNWADKIIKHAAKALPCSREEAAVHRKVLDINLKLLQELDTLVEELERNIGLLFHQTTATCLLSIQGLSEITAAEFIAEIGNPDKYTCPGEWIKLAGLNASRYQSGKTDRAENPITKVGNRQLRYIVFMIARNISRWEPFFVAYRNKFCDKGKHIRRVYGAVANKFLRVAFYMLRRRLNFDPNYEEKREKKCLTQK